ncbi:hypothetical protein [Hymenobacter nitidus]|uniref:hypothetical protein n=1 Tax=Hymenobacter nitidus TaxID=2880929 RepID=UPI001CF46AB8|nr:hypothetical protein [Hymenobacter nitidus]
MSRILFFCLLLLGLPGCLLLNKRGVTSCACCYSTYTSITSAAACITQDSGAATAADKRLYLLAFVQNDLKANQQLGWGIIKSPAVIEAAQKNYLLITLPMQEPLMYNLSAELQDVISKHRGQPFFVIVNQALYPFADWKADQDDAFIISRLENGNGP